jgi:hypothetical protein
MRFRITHDWQLGDIRRDPPRLVLREQLGRRSPAGLILEIDIGKRAAVIADGGGKRRPSASGCLAHKGRGDRLSHHQQHFAV